RSGLSGDDRQIASGRIRATGGLLDRPVYPGWWLFDAGDPVTGSLLFEGRDERGAGGVFGRMLAARMEHAAGRRIRGRGYVAAQHDAALLHRRVRDRDGREQRLRVRHQGLAVEVDGRRELDNLAEIHDGDAIGDVLD